MKTRNFISVLLALLLLNCNSKTSNCILTLDAIKQHNAKKILINQTQSEVEIEDKSFATDTIGGFYSFYKSGSIKSYYFLTKSDSSYDKKNKSSEIVERDSTTNRFSFCSYAELYDSSGHIQKTFGNPLVYKDVLLKTKDSTIFFTLYFFSLNKEFKAIDVKTNNDRTFSLQLTDDTIFTNMKRVSFNYNFGLNEHIRAYVEAKYFDKCTGEEKLLKDTLSLHYWKNNAEK